MKSGRSLVDLAKELERQLATKKDMVVPSSLMRYRTSEQGASSVDIDEHAVGCVGDIPFQTESSRKGVDIWPETNSLDNASY